MTEQTSSQDTGAKENDKGELFFIAMMLMAAGMSTAVATKSFAWSLVVISALTLIGYLLSDIASHLKKLVEQSKA